MRVDVSLDHRDLDAELAALHARIRERGDALRPLPTASARMPGLVFRCRETHGEFHVYVEDPARDVLAACTVFQRVVELERHAARCLRSPHSRVASGYRERGVARAIYRWALDAGLCLLSGPRQSPAACRLWLSLARTNELAYVRARAGGLQRLDPVAHPERLADLDSRMLLLGAGWSDAQLPWLPDSVVAGAQENRR
jgi:hypothetical protein